MLDWMTLTIEAIGVVIFFVWIVIPIQEFRTILKRLREKDAGRAERGPSEG